jgi:hypothetical protein
MAITTFNDIPITTPVNSTDYLVGYRNNFESKMTAANVASYINSNYTYTNSFNTKQLIGPLSVPLNMNGYQISNCKNGIKAWITFNGILLNNTSQNNNGTGDPCVRVGSPVFSTTDPTEINYNINSYTYTFSAYHIGISTLLSQYQEIFITTPSISGFTQILSFPTANSFTFKYINTNSNIATPISITWYSKANLSSYNISSVTRVSEGCYRIQFLSGVFKDSYYACMGGSMEDSCYSVALAGSDTSVTEKTSQSVQIYWNTSANGDSSMVFFAAVGN